MAFISKFKMGAYISSYFQSTNDVEIAQIQRVEDNINFDNMTKSDIIEFIKKLKIKSIMISPELIDALKTIEPINHDLIGMCIEFYLKTYNASIKIPNIQTNSIYKKKRFTNVKPGFNKNAIYTVNPPRDLAIINEDINNIYAPIMILFNTNNITLDEFMQSFNDNVGKKDMIGSSKRLYQSMPEFLRRCLINVFNQIYKTKHNINKISFAKCVFVYKSAKKGDVSDINSFRQIMSIPNIVSVFHRILMIRLSDYMIRNNYIDTDIQKGGIKSSKSPLFEQVYKLKETLRHSNVHSKPLVITFIDIVNAYGNISRANLFKILEFYRVNNTFIEYFREYYNNLEYYVDCHNIQSELIKWQDGLIQGDPISPLFFVIVINYILKYINNKYAHIHGYEINNNRILFTAFVDDIAIITNSSEGAQIVFDELSKILLSFGLTIGIPKCAIMLVNIACDFTGTLGTIQKVMKFKYLGEYISADGTCIESFNDFMRFLRGRLYGIDVKKIDNIRKVELFNTHMRPWIQRRLVMMYDISNVNKLYVTKVVREYAIKWDYMANSNVALELFNNSLRLIEDTSDSWIKTLPLYEDNTDNEDYAELNSKMVNPNIEISYETIETDDNIDNALA